MATGLSVGIKMYHRAKEESVMEALIQTSKSAIKVRVPNIYRFLFIFCIGMMLNETVLVSAVDPPHATIASVKVPDREIVNQPIFIDVAVINDSGDAKAGGISLSLPDNPLASIIHADTTKATVYPVGNKIWSKTEKSAIPSKHVLIEAWQEPWHANKAHHFRLKAMPVKAGTLRLLVRATMECPRN